MKRRLSSAPVFLQVMGLALAAIFAAQLASVLAPPASNVDVAQPRIASA
jgi:hypothetical protein